MTSTPFATAARVADTVLLVAGVLAAVVAAAMAYQYGVAGDRRFTSALGAVLYFGVPIALAVGAFGARRARPATKVVLASAGIVAGVLTYSLELSLESARRPWQLPRWQVDVSSDDERAEIMRIARNAGVTFDFRDRSKVIVDLNRAGVAAVPPLTLPRDARRTASIEGGKVVPLVTVSNREIVVCNESGQWIVHKTDEHGFNNPNGIWALPKIDVVAVGDSFTYGYCVPEDRNYVALIRRAFPATLNLGFSGGPLSMSAIVTEYAAAITPRTVLWFHTEGIDLEEHSRQQADPLYRRYIRDPRFRQGLIERQAEIDRELITHQPAERARVPMIARTVLERVEPVAKLTALREKLGLVFATRASDASARADTDALDDANIERFMEVLIRNRKHVTAWGGSFYFVYVPHWDRFGSSRPGDTERSKILPRVRAAGIPVIDTVPDFEAHGDPLSLFALRVFGHYNEAGNELVARAVLKVIAPRRPPLGPERAHDVRRITTPPPDNRLRGSGA